MSIQDTVHKVEAGAKKLQWILDLNAELQRIGALDQAAVEAEARAKKAQAEVATVEGTLAALAQKIEAAEKRNEEILREGQDVVQQAHESANATIAAAEIKAAALIENADKQLTQAKVAVDAVNERKRNELDALDAKVKAAEAKVAAAYEELQEVENRIAKAKAGAMEAIRAQLG